MSVRHSIEKSKGTKWNTKLSYLSKMCSYDIRSIRKIQSGQADKSDYLFHAEKPGSSGKNFSKPPLEELDEALEVLSQAD